MIHDKNGNVRKNVTSRLARPLLPRNAISIVILGVCDLNYPAFKVHVQYYIVICGLSQSTIFLYINS
jgi:hypothetical protein